MPWAPYERALSSPGELPPARLVIHRQTSAMHNVSGRWLCIRGRAFDALLPPASISYR